MPALQFSGVGDLATWISLAFTVIAGAAAAGAFWMLRRRERRQALTELHSSLTSGETATARNILGTLLYSRAEDDLPGRGESIEAYFALIWALQRARNVFRTFGIHWTRLDAPQGRLSSVMRSGTTDATLALTWNLVEIAENVIRFHDVYSHEWQVDDEDAWADISAYVDAESLRRSSGLGK
ncbi:hypothetical protein AB0N64_02240 [Microbacterium sp. NPDC089318]